MSFCCGAGMIGAAGTLRHFNSRIHNVPLVFCPVCYRVEVHHLIEDEYELLADFAHGDHAPEVDFREFVEVENEQQLFENCINHSNQDPLDIVLNQIDMGLDLMLVAKQWKDVDWEQQLIKRLGALSKRRNRLEQEKSVGGLR